jgi:DNA-binding PadR family transcriptional regulator
MKSAELGPIELHVLIALGAGPAHGYAVGKELEQRSAGRLKPTTGTLYQALRRLTDAGLIRSVAAPDAVDSRRKYFELTAAGRKAVALEAKRWEDLLAVARERKLYPSRA